MHHRLTKRLATSLRESVSQLSKLALNPSAKFLPSLLSMYKMLFCWRVINSSCKMRLSPRPSCLRPEGYPAHTSIQNPDLLLHQRQESKRRLAGGRQVLRRHIKAFIATSRHTAYHVSFPLRALDEDVSNVKLHKFLKTTASL